MKHDHHCSCHEHNRDYDTCSCGHHHHSDHCDCGCGHDHMEEGEDYSAVSAMFGLDDDVPADALSLLQLEMNECDDLSELLGLGRNPDVDDILSEAIADLSPKKKKTLMNLAVILHDYLPD